MKIPAIRAKIGTWEYYVATLTFEQINQYVSKIDDNLHKSEGLKDLIQRSITNNYISIKDYIIGQPERFFNSLVLAVYDDYPDWREIEFTYEDLETYQMGVLEFPGTHKIFPVDGQHRVEGIKEALKENPELKDQRIAVIFIGHLNTPEGHQKTRRLFTTLNRYAKPVKLDDIIALDEDDCVAIFTRKLLEEYNLFTGKRVIYAKQKAIPTTNKTSITSIITLYQANLEVLKIFLKEQDGKLPSKGKLDEFLKFRPGSELLAEFESFLFSFWDSFRDNLSAIGEYLAIADTNNPAEGFRNNVDGGNILFRPIGFLPIVKAALAIYDREDSHFNEIFSRFNEINLNLDSTPWHYVLWNPIDKKMIMSSDRVALLLLIYMYNYNLLTQTEMRNLRKDYAARISHTGELDESVLVGIPVD